MTKYVDPRLLAGTAVRAPETKDGGDTTTLGVEVKKAVDDLTRTFEAFRAKNDERLKEVEKKGSADVVTKDEVEKINKAIDAAIEKAKAEVKTRVDELEAKANRIALGQGGEPGKKQRTAEQIEYGQKFEEFFRKGEDAVGGKYALRDLEKKAIAASTDNDQSGGFTVRPEIDTQIDMVLKEVSPIRQVAGVRQIGTSSYKKLVNQHGVSSGWIGEKESRIQTLAPDLTELEYPVFEIYAMPAATQTLLDDASVDIGQWIAGEVDLEFAQQEGKAFISGDGVKKPRGFLGGYPVVADSAYVWGSIGYVPTKTAGDFSAAAPADAFIDLVFALKAPYRGNASFIINRKTMAAVRKLKDGQGNYLADLRLRDSSLVETIFGYPVREAEDMPDIAANSLSAAFGDFRRGYTIVDRMGTRVLRDQFTAKPYVLFYTTKRVGGGVSNFEAIKLLRFSAS